MDRQITVTINVTDVSELAEANREPVFNDGPSTTREVAENTAVKDKHRCPGGSEGC